MKKSLFGALFLLIFSIVGFGAYQVYAAADPVSGYAWSSNIGWIQFATGVGSPTGVRIESTTGNFSGYAWSSNIGWINFGANSCGAQANVNFVSGAVVGWAKAIAGDAFTGVNEDGWDGCIELSGTNHTSPNAAGTGGVTYNPSTGDFTGYAWGDDVVGWVQFNTASPVTYAPPGPPAPGGISGTCSAVSSSPSFTPPNQNVSPGTQVTFQANPSSGTSPYQYNWSGTGYQASNLRTLPYSSSGPGPTVTIQDSNLDTTLVISCPNVVVLAPLTNSDIKIGRTVTGAAGQTVVVSQNDKIAVVWDATLTEDYAVTAVTVKDSNGAVVSNTGLNGWNSGVVNATASNNGDGTITWDGDTGTTLSAGTSSSVLPHGTYKLAITFSNGVTTQTIEATLRVVLTTETEI